MCTVYMSMAAMTIKPVQAQRKDAHMAFYTSLDYVLDSSAAPDFSMQGLVQPDLEGLPVTATFSHLHLKQLLQHVNC